jgi:intracellular sulfur oxidation DsrE/DsrF family protein
MRKVLFFLIFFSTCSAFAEQGAGFQQTPYEEQKVVFEFFFDHPAKINGALYWVRSLMTTLNNDPYGYAPDFLDIKVIIHGTEIAALAKKNYGIYSEAVERMRYYSQLGVEFKVCSVSAHEFGYQAEDLQDFVQLIPSAVPELAHWQNQGYALIVPKVWEKHYATEEIR